MTPLAVITGASSGIGAAFDRRLSGDGYNVLLVARDRERLEELEQELRLDGRGDVAVLAADLTSDAELGWVEKRIRGARNLEFLSNCARFGTKRNFAETEIASQDSMVRLHVVATMRLTHAALPGLISRK